MKKKAVCILAAAFALLSLSACSAFENEYVSVHDYTPSVQEQSVSGGKISVRNYAGLKNALLNMAYSGTTEGNIVFDAAYDGDTTEDMASACWAVRTQDALCAYCVENIAYELNKIVTINEATVYVSYSRFTESPELIEHLSFSSEAEASILNALRNGDRRIALLVGRSAFSAEDMAAQVLKAYRENPIIVPCEPIISVNIFSGTGSQRLYEIHLRYPFSQEEFDRRSEQLLAFSFPEDEAPAEEAERAYTACQYLEERCVLTDNAGANSAYCALVDREADSEGIAFAYVELCHRLGLDCRIVYGQLDWQEHCWNIVKIDGDYYHVDVTGCMLNGEATGFLKNDESFWGLYRWDVASYPRCTGDLEFFGSQYQGDDYADVFGEEESETQSETGEQLPGTEEGEGLSADDETP